MLKYSTPLVEVVCFNASDAPRIGMQWWYAIDSQTTSFVAAPNWQPQNPNDLVIAIANENLTHLGINCTSVTTYFCMAENIQGAAGYNGNNVVADDGSASC